MNMALPGRDSGQSAGADAFNQHLQRRVFDVEPPAR